MITVSGPALPAPYRNIVSGRWYGPGPHTPGVSASGAGVLSAIPFWVPVSFQADRIACEVTTAAASSAVRLGVYASSPTDHPDSVVLDAGTVDSTTTGVKELTIAQTLNRGLYWLAAVPQGGSPTLRTIGAGSSPPVAPATFDGSVGSVGMSNYFMTSVNGALPVWSGSSAGGSGYKVMVRAA